MDVIFQFVQQTSLQKLTMAIFANLEKCKNQIQDTSSSSKSSQLNWNDRLFDFNLNPLFYFSFSSSDHSSDLPTFQTILFHNPPTPQILILNSNTIYKSTFCQGCCKAMERKWKHNSGFKEIRLHVKKNIKGR